MKPAKSQALISLCLLTLSASGSMTNVHSLDPYHRNLVANPSNALPLAIVRRASPPTSLELPPVPTVAETQNPERPVLAPLPSPLFGQTQPQRSVPPPAFRAGQPSRETQSQGPKRSISPNTFERGLRQVADYADQNNKLVFDHFDALRKSDQKVLEARLNTHEQYIKASTDTYLATTGALTGYISGAEQTQRRNREASAHTQPIEPGPLVHQQGGANPSRQSATSPGTRPPPAFQPWPIEPGSLGRQQGGANPSRQRAVSPGAHPPPAFQPWQHGPISSQGQLPGSPRGQQFGSRHPLSQGFMQQSEGLHQGQQIGGFRSLLQDQIRQFGGITAGHQFGGHHSSLQTPSPPQGLPFAGMVQGQHASPGILQGQRTFSSPPGRGSGLQSQGARGRGTRRGRNQQ